MSLTSIKNKIFRLCPGILPELSESFIGDAYETLMAMEWNRLNVIRAIATVRPYSIGTVAIVTSGDVYTVTGLTAGIDWSGRTGYYFKCASYPNAYFRVASNATPITLTLQDWVGTNIAVPWQATTTYTLPYSVRPTSYAEKQYVLTTAGTSGGSNPFTPGDKEGSLILDGTCVWRCAIGETYTIFKTVYSIASIRGVYDVAADARIDKKDRAYFDAIDPGRSVSGSSPSYWAFAGLDSSDNTQIEIYPVPSSEYTLMVYGKAPYIVPTVASQFLVPEQLVESLALVNSFRHMEVFQPTNPTWSKRLTEQTAIYANLLETFKYEDFCIGQYPDKVKDELFRGSFVYSDEFQVDHDLE